MRFSAIVATVVALVMTSSLARPSKAQNRQPAAAASASPDPERAYRDAIYLRNMGIMGTCIGIGVAGLGAGLIVAGDRVGQQPKGGEGSALLSSVGYFFAAVGGLGVVTGVVLWVGGQKSVSRLRALRAGRVAFSVDASGIRGEF